MISFLKSSNYKFYIYAPKSDPYLRKKWELDHPKQWHDNLLNLSHHCSELGIDFGIGLSPFEVHFDYTDQKKDLFIKKIKKINEYKPKILGLFFDDMKSSESLAKVQIELVNLADEVFEGRVVFCPTFYSFDPILDKVFGNRPENYLEEISKGINNNVEIMWTGPKVISPEITEQHLNEVTSLLRRRPFIWDNFYANDGPKQCKFLKLINSQGRTSKMLASGWAINPMNQSYLSELVLEQFVNSNNSIEDIILKRCDSDSKIIIECLNKFNFEGFDKIEDKNNLINELSSDNPYCLQIKQWLEGEFIVDNDCLTD